MLTDTAPPRLDFSTTSTSVPGGRSFTELSPLVDQLFYVGDGLTGEGVGSLQTFNVPDEATHLYLGLMDGSRFIHGPDFYGNNDGSFAVQGVVVVPEPAAGAMGAIAGVMAACSWLCRRLVAGRRGLRRQT